MAKQVTRLSDAATLRLRDELERQKALHDHRRLAERLVELAPLTRDAVPLDEPAPVLENSSPTEPGQSAEIEAAGDVVAKRNALPPPLPPPLPSTALVLKEEQEPAALVVAEAPAVLARRETVLQPADVAMEPPATKSRAFGFLTGLTVAIAVGAALYAVLAGLG